MGQGSSSSNSTPQIVNEETLALTGKSKGKAKRKMDGKKNLDVSKVKCFIFHKQGHFSSMFPNNKKKSNTQMNGFVEVDEINRNFDEDFFSITCMESTTGRNIWFINS